jgi:hypothetical protein
MCDFKESTVMPFMSSVKEACTIQTTCMSELTALFKEKVKHILIPVAFAVITPV